MLFQCGIANYVILNSKRSFIYHNLTSRYRSTGLNQNKIIYLNDISILHLRTMSITYLGITCSYQQHRYINNFMGWLYFSTMK